MKIMLFKRGRFCVGLLLVVDLVLALDSVKDASENPLDSICQPHQTGDLAANGRLPKSLSPIHYTVRLHPFIHGNRSIEGYVEITFRVLNSTDKITLNILDINMKNDTAKVVNKVEDLESTLVIKNQTYDAYMQTYTAKLGECLTKGKIYKFSINFTGYLNSKLVGFYLSRYKDANGSERRIASTQFSPTDARRAFPSFDEPAFKATFEVILVRSPNMTAHSNMPLVKTISLSDGDWLEDHFNRTVVMPTYIVGFLVADFEKRFVDVFNNYTEFSVIARPELLNQTSYASSLASNVLLFLQEYFGSEFPLPKLDMAAIPEFKFRGMENWGLIMYREGILLFDTLDTTVDSKKDIAKVVAHEVAHSWFGNLVTPEWWSDLWLKEGFANFMAYLTIDVVEPSWKFMENAGCKDMSDAFDLDSYNASHPIIAKVDHPDRIAEVFDDISYLKGVSLIRMMHQFLTDKVFKIGMTDYLNTLKYKNAVQDQLWHFLTLAWENNTNDTSGLTVKEIMDSWTLQEGYPLITMTRDNGTVKFTQEVFTYKENEFLDDISARCLQENKTVSSTNCARWWVPISYTDSLTQDFNTTSPNLWLSPSSDTLNVEDPWAEDAWVLLNIQKTGFYRVNYEEENWLLLISQLKEDYSVIPPLNRAQILDDAYNLARAGRLNYSLVFELMDYIKEDRSYSPWYIFLRGYNHMYELVKFSGEKHLFVEHLLGLLVPLFNATGFAITSNDSYHEQQIQSESTKWACKLDYEPCISTSQSLFEEWLNSPKHQRSLIIPVNVKPVVLCTGIRYGSALQWNQTFQLYLESEIPTEKIDILKALGCTQNSSIIERYLEIGFDESSGISKQDAYHVINAVAISSESGRIMAWNFIRDRWRYILNYLGSGSKLLWEILEVTKSLNSHKLLKEFKQFRNDEKDHLGSARQSVDNALEIVELNVKWMDKYFPEVVSILLQKNTHL